MNIRIDLTEVDLAHLAGPQDWINLLQVALSTFKAHLSPPGAGATNCACRCTVYGASTEHSDERTRQNSRKGTGLNDIPRQMPPLCKTPLRY